MKKEKLIPITKENLILAFAELNFTHDESRVKVGTIMINRNMEAHKVTRIDKDDCGRRQFWSGKKCLGVQYNEPHNMLTKPPFYAYEFKVQQP